MNDVDDVVSPPDTDTDSLASPATPPAPDDVSTDELLRTWWSFSEAALAVSWSLAQGLDQTGTLTLPVFDVLGRLHRAPGRSLTLSGLAADLGLTLGGFTKLVDRMELDGLVDVERNRRTRGVVDITLTARGREVTTAALTRHVADLRQHLLAPLGASGLRALGSLSETLRRSAG